MLHLHLYYIDGSQGLSVPQEICFDVLHGNPFKVLDTVSAFIPWPRCLELAYRVGVHTSASNMWQQSNLPVVKQLGIHNWPNPCISIVDSYGLQPEQCRRHTLHGRHPIPRLPEFRLQGLQPMLPHQCIFHVRH